MCVRKCTRALTFENAVAKSWEVIQMYQQLQRGAPSSKSGKSGVCVCVCVCVCLCVYRLTDDERIHESGKEICTYIHIRIRRRYIRIYTYVYVGDIRIRIRRRYKEIYVYVYVSV
jgi:hypothetical protein